MTNPLLADVDWVKERTACSTGAIFEVLKAAVSKDVDTRQKAISVASASSMWPSLTFYPKDTEFRVVLHGFNARKGHEVHKTLAFALDGQEILVYDENLRPTLKGIPTLGDDGRCRLKVTVEERELELELELWQFRRRALESLFFNADLP